MPTFPELLHISVTTTFQNCWSCSYNMPNATPDDQPTLIQHWRVYTGLQLAHETCTDCYSGIFLHTAWIQWC